MYRMEKLECHYSMWADVPIEGKIVDFLNHYNIPKENIIKINIYDSSRATIIFEETEDSKTLMDDREVREYNNALCTN